MENGFHYDVEQKIERQKSVHAVTDHPCVKKVMSAEDFTIPGKSAAFVPYETVLLLYSDCDDVRTLEVILDEYDVQFDKVIGIAPNDMYYDCEYIGYVSLVHKST